MVRFPTSATSPAAPFPAASSARSCRQILVHEPPSDHPGDCVLHLLEGVHLPHVLAAREGAHVPLEMLRGQLVVDALVGPLQHATERFHAVGMGLVPDVLANAVIDRLVVLQPLVRLGLVRVDLRAGRGVLVD